MTMTFYLGKDYHLYEKKFKNIKEFIRGTRALKTGSNAETFRWMLDRFDDYIQEEKAKEE